MHVYGIELSFNPDEDPHSVQWQKDGFLCFLKYVVLIDFGDGSQQPLVHLSHRYNSVEAMALNGCIVHK